MQQGFGEVAEYLFEVKERADGTPWIMMSPRRKGLSVLSNALLGFDLPKGTSLGQAEDVAKFLNRNVGSVCCTTFGLRNA